MPWPRHDQAPGHHLNDQSRSNPLSSKHSGCLEFSGDVQTDQPLDSNDPSQDKPPEPELTIQFVPGYESYQRRVGEMIKEQHRRVFG